MVKVIYTDQLVYKVVIWVFFGSSLWTEKVALIKELIIRGGGGDRFWTGPGFFF